MAKDRESSLFVISLLVVIVVCLICIITFAILSGFFSRIAEAEKNKNPEKSKEYKKKSNIFFGLAIGVFVVFIISLLIVTPIYGIYFA